MLKKLLIGVVAIVVVLIVVGFMLPSHVHVERSATIAASAEQIWPIISDFARFNEWSPWAKRDPATKYTFEGGTSGVGAKMSWTSDHPEVGNGSQQVLEAKAPTFLKNKLDFGPDGGAEATFQLVATEGGTTVTWSLDHETGMNPIARYVGLMFDGFVGPDYEAGLASLKQIAEAEAQR